MFLGFVATSNTAFLFAASSTLISWIGNEAIDFWIARKDFEKLEEIKLKFIRIYDRNRQTSSAIEIEYNKKWKSALNGILLIAGIILITLNLFISSPKVPVAGITAIMMAGCVSIVLYSLPSVFELLHAIGGIVERCCCCFFKKEEFLEKEIENENKKRRSHSFSTVYLSPSQSRRSKVIHSDSDDEQKERKDYPVNTESRNNTEPADTSSDDENDQHQNSSRRRF